jgi:hypothetical protein
MVAQKVKACNLKMGASRGSFSSPDRRRGAFQASRVLVLARARTVATDLMGLKERGQPFRKELPDTIKSRFDGFWSASQNLADLSVRKIVVRK